MARPKSGKYKDNYDYQNQYHLNNMKNKMISFNKSNPDDMVLYEHMMNHKNVTQYIKALIRKDMEEKTDKLP